MTPRPWAFWPAIIGLTLFGAGSAAVRAQDSTRSGLRAPLLGADTSRMASFSREYDMFAWIGDSVVSLGTRAIRVDSAMHAGTAAWLIVETRTGAVPAAESLYVSRSVQPVQWTASLGNARLTLAFGRDSIFGGTTGPGGRQTIVLSGGPSLIVSTAMMETLFPLLQWTPYRSDSVQVLVVDHVSSSVIPAELAVIGEDSVDARPAWIVVLRAPARSVLFWIDQETGTLLRLQQPLPLNGASMLEYRLRATPAATSPGAPSPLVGR
jgi:hypothetical protein